MFLDEKRNYKSDNANSLSTIKRYEYNKKLLNKFNDYSSGELTFKSINKKFYNQFIEFCVEEENHSANTLSRNIGLLKTFLFWALNNKYTYNDSFKDFKNVKRFKTDEIALTFKEVNDIYEFDLKNNSRLIRVRDLFVFGCSDHPPKIRTVS